MEMEAPFDGLLVYEILCLQPRDMAAMLVVSTLQIISNLHENGV